MITNNTQKGEEVMLGGLKIWQKLTLIGVVFVLPFAVLLYFYIRGTNETIQFSLREKQGDRYQRPLEKLFLHLTQHKLLSERFLNGSQEVSQQIDQTARRIDGGFQELAMIQMQSGKLLQVT